MKITEAHLQLTKELWGKNPILIGILKRINSFYGWIGQTYWYILRWTWWYLVTIIGTAMSELLININKTWLKISKGRHVLFVEDIIGRSNAKNMFIARKLLLNRDFVGQTRGTRCWNWSLVYTCYYSKWVCSRLQWVLDYKRENYHVTLRLCRSFWKKKFIQIRRSIFNEKQ